MSTAHIVATAEKDQYGRRKHDIVRCVTGEANASLIAAAPDLLEACQTFAQWLQREEAGFAGARDTPEGERAWREWYDENIRLCGLAQEQARAAIARATGATHD